MAEPQRLKLEYESRYRDTTLRTDYQRVYELWERPIELNTLIEKSHRYRVTEVDVGRLDLLAWRFYNNVKLWWVLAAVNEMVNPFKDMYPGQILYVPDEDEIISMLNRPPTVVPEGSLF